MSFFNEVQTSLFWLFAIIQQSAQIPLSSIPLIALSFRLNIRHDTRAQSTAASPLHQISILAA